MNTVVASVAVGLACASLTGCGAGSRGSSFSVGAVATVAAATALEVAGPLSQPTSSTGDDLDVPGYLQAPPDPLPAGAGDPAHAAFDLVPALMAIDRLDL